MILFRADGNPDIGSGHIMRCLSVADAFAGKGIRPLFVTADAHLSELIKSRGHEVRVLGTDYRDTEAELPLMRELITSAKPECVIVDSYFVTRKYLESIRQLVRTVYIDDLAAFAYPADVLINYNIYAGRGVYERLYGSAGEPLPELVLGTGYAPLRGEFAGLPKKEIKEKCTDILISTGGADILHLALKAARYLCSGENGGGYTFHLLIGSLNPDRAEIEGICAGNDRIVLHCGVRDMRTLISSCDIAVSAAGSTLYEICACGVPLITYVLADNQLEGAKTFEEKGLALSLGDIRQGFDISRCFELAGYLDSSFGLRTEMSEKMQAAVDGLGAGRICSRLKP